VPRPSSQAQQARQYVSTRPVSHMRVRLDQAYKQYCDGAELQESPIG